MGDIYLNHINTRFDPQYIASGKQGSFVLVEDEYQQNNEVIACYKLPFGNHRIDAFLFHHGSNSGYKLVFQNTVSDTVTEIETDDLNKAIENMKNMIVETLGEYRELIEAEKPDLFTGAGQLALFE